MSGFVIDRESAIRDSAAAAAKWWADRLRDAAGVGDNGDSSSGGVLSLLTNAIRMHQPPSEEDCGAFEEILRARITRALVLGPEINEDGWRSGRSRDSSGWHDGGIDLWMSVDYHPCIELYAALIEAGVATDVADVAALPLKTYMKASARRVIVAHGYGARWKEIYGPTWGASYWTEQRFWRLRQDEVDACWDRWDEAGRPGQLRTDLWQGPLKDVLDDGKSYESETCDRATPQRAREVMV